MNATADRVLDAGQSCSDQGVLPRLAFRTLLLKLASSSIIHHFPTKAELGVAIIRRTGHFCCPTAGDQRDPAKSSWDALEFYFSPYLLLPPDKVCLCGALAGEIPALPETMRVEVKQFMEASNG